VRDRRQQGVRLEGDAFFALDLKARNTDRGGGVTGQVIAACQLRPEGSVGETLQRAVYGPVETTRS
jgi:hypothetical protein